MTSRLFRDGDFDRGREPRRDFDPIAEGRRYKLAPEVSLAIWKYVCRESTDSSGQRDEPRARELFHQVAARVPHEVADSAPTSARERASVPRATSRRAEHRGATSWRPGSQAGRR